MQKFTERSGAQKVNENQFSKLSFDVVCPAAGSSDKTRFIKFRKRKIAHLFDKHRTRRKAPFRAMDKHVE